MDTTTKPKHADYTVAIPGVDPRLTVRRLLCGYSYPRNGNVHNPTPQYRWNLLVEGRLADTGPTKRSMVDAARRDGAAYIAELAQ